MKIALCDDDLPDLNLLVTYCRQYDASLPIVTFSSAREMLKAYIQDPFDIVFLDIEMAHPNGYEAAVELSNQPSPPIIIFTTKSLNYAIRGYGIALRYLPKPISYQMFISALQIALEQKTPAKIYIEAESKTFIFVLSEIKYVESFGHYITVHSKSKTKTTIRYSFSSFLAKLPSVWFVQTQKSYCVNMNYIEHVEKKDLVLIDDSIIPIGRRYRKQFDAKLLNFLKGS